MTRAEIAAIIRRNEELRAAVEAEIARGERERQAWQAAKQQQQQGK